MTAGGPKVSVVVPAYNAAGTIQTLVDSLLRQSMPAAEFEVVFIDDGSTDDTGALLDKLAAAHPHIQVLHTENAGWPSRPRNLGIARARGEYVQFVDDDDWLADEALERLHAYAVRHDADIAIGRMVGHGRTVPRELFRVDRPDATLHDAPLIDSMTCHKMFRRAFLLEHDLRFPEDRRRLEDHHLVTRAYLLARRVSVLSGYTCYHHAKRTDGGNLTASRLDPAEYFDSLRAVLDIVDAHVPPGPQRDRLHRRWLRNEMLARLRGKRLRDAPRDWADQVVDEVGRTIRERFAPGVAAALPALQRTVTALAAEGRVEDLHRLAEWEAGVRGVVRLTGYELTGSTLVVTLTGQLRTGDGPITFTHVDGRDLLVVPVEEIPTDLLDCTEELRHGRLDVLARSARDGTESFLPVSFEVKRVTVPAGGLRVVYRGTATVDVDTLDGGPDPGDWALKARVSSFGWTKDAKVPLALSVGADGPVVVDKRPSPTPPPPPEKVGLWRRVQRTFGRRPGATGPGAVGAT
ncbi:glycosyltransferase family 2 protein [Verrucosispora sp. NA02020]|uniref:glycosyltransferase family 2 protein n=1 Tax=Verrucosispora sp. NA02020 TaxID=2742132 RepID=UPI0015900225|nr:glycosyltransferase family 2 protein [Verrucosispora sp. NA02020]QKW16161.1 glycosyltransferase family 2 protein [Verrucosispora sp. NA02020]